LLEYLSGEDVLENVRSILQRHLAAHLDLGVAAWRNPAQGQGFFAAWRASAGFDMAWEMDELPNVRDEILHMPNNPVDVLLEELPGLLPDESQWYGYLERLSMELPGCPACSCGATAIRARRRHAGGRHGGLPDRARFAGAPAHR
jgi:uncharacterized protein YbcC (UPF0753/DUF2309 family)